MNSEKTWTHEEIANMLHVSPRTIEQAILDGRLRGTKSNGYYIVGEESMKQFMQHGNPFQVRSSCVKKDEESDSEWRSHVENVRASFAGRSFSDSVELLREDRDR